MEGEALTGSAESAPYAPLSSALWGPHKWPGVSQPLPRWWQDWGVRDPAESPLLQRGRGLWVSRGPPGPANGRPRSPALSYPETGRTGPAPRGRKAEA